VARSRESGQHGLFGGGSAPTAAPFELRDAAPWSEEERLASEYAIARVLRFGHPLEKFASRLEEWEDCDPWDKWRASGNGKEIAVAVLIVGTRPMRSKKGARWAIFTIQDMSGIQELLAFPESFARFEGVLKPGAPLLLKVRVQVEEAGTRLSLQEARRIEDIVETHVANQEFRIRMDMQSLNEATLDRLERIV